ncbi:nicotinate-nucleotide adenylyltransferase [Granulicatella balaenopterae]|uniref:Probable nicotinate-nucleotide adenylyltransferase n=1 Tax=Granulicatella balaenopterae TaxID=137733 RepID=A0A1H9IDQ8_9LACT|nr:nicotinate-nucleotide adenylyltransferase [Granulicatella balaenopterae]SEQ72684.1 nicotinate-nucleotide adenylyltransferase [Granulicatella balaenopterae]
MIQESVGDNSKERVGILGGSFNPVHIGHLIMAEQAKSQLGLDKVLLMPSNQPPHIDTKKTIDAELRVAMLERAIAGNEGFGLELIELERLGKSYTFDTMQLLVERYPNKEFYFIIGGDMVEYLPKWYRIDELLDLITFVAVKRVGYQVESSYPVEWIDSPMIDISSTMIRNSIKDKQSIRYLVPTSVEEFILERGLYQHD